MLESLSEFEWIGFHRLIRRIAFTGIISNAEPLTIGAGKAALFEPAEFITAKAREASGREYPYIPGSSIKGALRSYTVKLMRSQGVSVCDGVPRATCLRGREFEHIERRGRGFEEVLRAIKEGSIRLCLNCLIFGSPGFSSHTRIYDSYPVDGTWRIGYRYMVSLDRKTAGVRAGPFVVEFIEPGAKFRFAIDFLNLPNYAVGVVAQALLDMDMGLLKLGSFKTRGFGRMKIEELHVEVHDYTATAPTNGTLPGLDPIDVGIQISADWRKTLTSFTSAWSSAIDKLRKISGEGWRWVK